MFLNTRIFIYQYSLFVNKICFFILTYTAMSSFADKLETIDSLHTVFQGLAIFAGCIFVMTRVIVPNITHLIGAVCALVIIYYLYQRDNSQIDDLNKELDVKLKSLIPKPEYFHIDADFITLFYDIRNYRDYNAEEYDLSLIHI